MTVRYKNFYVFIQNTKSITMQTDEKERLVISLIKDDLIHSKLMDIIIELRQKVTYYDLYLGDTIFQLLEFKDDQYSDDVFEQYVELRKKARSVNMSKSTDELDKLAKEIFELLQEKARPGLH